MWPEPHNTLDLLQQAGTGDAKAVNELLERHRLGLRRMIEMRNGTAAWPGGSMPVMWCRMCTWKPAVAWPIIWPA